MLWSRPANALATEVSPAGWLRVRGHMDDAALCAGVQTTEFQLLQEGVVDFAIGSTINGLPR